MGFARSVAFRLAMSERFGAVPGGRRPAYGRARGYVAGQTLEMVLGVHERQAVAFAHRGPTVRVYAPYGAMWLRYSMRRAAEARGS